MHGQIRFEQVGLSGWAGLAGNLSGNVTCFTYAPSGLGYQPPTGPMQGSGILDQGLEIANGYRNRKNSIPRVGKSRRCRNVQNHFHVLRGWTGRFVAAGNQWPGHERRILLSEQSDPAMRALWPLICIAAFIAQPSFAQKVVDQNSVAPEFRAAAEKRRAEQIRILECNHRADEAKRLPRDRTAHINQCLDATAEK